MSAKTGILYATVDGHTLKICNKLKDQFLKNKQHIEVFSIDDFNGKIADYDNFVIGSSIRYGVHNKKIVASIKQNLTL
jgi:menaquinone-dependent protoporphyrinogen oxidase